jgi:hypothetical protein
MPVKAVAAWRIFGGGSGETFFGRKNWNFGMASGRHNRHMFSRRRAWVHRNGNTAKTSTLCCKLSWCFSWLSKVSEPDYEPTYFGIHHMDIADGTS